MFLGTSLIILIFIAIGVWFWQSSMRAKELAIDASKSACHRHQMQFLDGSTSFSKISLMRGRDGKIGILRRYHFEYFDGEFRHQGEIAIFRDQVVELMIRHHFNNMEENDNNKVIPFRKKNNS